ncbi:MAG: hypothetical protein II820_06475 [Ruminiclostridium sp.]|nr:hypothetical protein [Ruminiclostridium sp.]
MADAKQQDKSKDKKEINSEGVGFKTVMGGFDKNEVNLYINKLKKQMREERAELENRINNLQTNLADANREAARAVNEKKSAEQAFASASVPAAKDTSAETKKLIADLKAESDRKIMELRKSVLDERRNVAKFDKECAMAKMSEKKVREEFEKLKNKYLDLKKKGGGTPGKAVTTSNADEVMAEASAYAKEIVDAAKSYAAETVKACDKYKADVETELKARTITLNEIKAKLDEQINKTTAQQASSASRVKEVTEKIGALAALFDSFSAQFNSVNSQINSVTDNIDGICRQFNDTTAKISEATKQMSGFNDTLSGAKNEIAGISKVVSDTKDQIEGAKGKVGEAKAAADTQAAAADLSPISKIGEEITLAGGPLVAKLNLPVFDESKFNLGRFDDLKNKIKVETTFESDGSAADDDDDEFNDSGIISSMSMSIDSPGNDIPSDDELMSDMPDIISSPALEDISSPAAPAPAPSRQAPRDKTDRPGLDSNFEDFFLSEPKEDNMSGDIPLINTDGVGMIDDFSLDAAPEPIGSDFDLAPIDETKAPDKGKDLGEDIFDIAINPKSADDDTLANMMADAKAAEAASDFELTPTNLNFDESNTKSSKADFSDDFGEFADLFAAGSTQTTPKEKKFEKAPFRKPASDDPWNFGSESDDNESGLSSDSDLSDLLI